MLYNQNFHYISKIIYFKIINWHYNNFFVDYFKANKIIKLISQKYYQLSLRKNVKVYIKDYDVYLIFKIDKYKPYGNF